MYLETILLIKNIIPYRVLHKETNGFILFINNFDLLSISLTICKLQMYSNFNFPLKIFKQQKITWNTGKVSFSANIFPLMSMCHTMSVETGYMSVVSARCHDLVLQLWRSTEPLPVTCPELTSNHFNSDTCLLLLTWNTALLPI